jgi:DNA-binding beta-propeller fold protein YncE
MHFLPRVALTTLALCGPALAQRLIACDSNRSVSLVDITTGARTPLGTISLNVGISAGLAYDFVSGKLYVTSTGNDSLYVIDVTNWNATLIGNFGLGTVPVMHGIEWDPTTGTLYGMSQHNGGLYTLDTTTGAATLVGITGLTSFHNLVYNLFNDTMYMTNSATDSFYSIDRATGAATLIGPLTGLSNPNGCAFNLDNNTIYVVDNSTDNLYTVDPATGVPTTVGSVGSANLLGLVYIPGTGRLTRAVHGCGPATIVSTGHPQIGFTIETTIGNATGFPFVGFGLANLGIPFCGCTIGHEWALLLLGPTVSFTIPADPGIIGLSVHIQGLDFLGTGGCPDPLLTLTDTISVLIG